jgi:repressor LexA
MRNQTALTAIQAAVLMFVKDFQRENQGSPTRAEIAQHFGWSSANAAQEHLEALKRKGVITVRPNMARGIFVL